MINVTVYVQPWTEEEKRKTLSILLPWLVVTAFDFVLVRVVIVDREHEPLEPSPQIEVEVPEVCSWVTLEGSASVLAGLICERFPRESNDFSVNVKCAGKEDYFRVP